MYLKICLVSWHSYKRVFIERIFKYIVIVWIKYCVLKFSCWRLEGCYFNLICNFLTATINSWALLFIHFWGLITLDTPWSYQIFSSYWSTTHRWMMKRNSFTLPIVQIFLVQVRSKTYLTIIFNHTFFRFSHLRFWKWYLCYFLYFLFVDVF